MVMEKNEAVLEMHPAEVCAFKNNIYICVFLRHNETSYWKIRKYFILLKIFCNFLPHHDINLKYFERETNEGCRQEFQHHEG